MIDTNIEYEEAIKTCRNLFLKKAADYGTAWRVLRTISVIDQIFIKALRIRNIQEKQVQKIPDDIKSEFTGILNYAVIGLIQLKFNKPAIEDLPTEGISILYDEVIDAAFKTMQAKNHDYGEAWRDMNQESFVDLILMKLMRIRQILQNDGRTLISEGIDANYIDIINYAVFAIILIDEGKHKG